MGILHLIVLCIRSMAVVAVVIKVIAVAIISSGSSQDLPTLISTLHVHGKTQALY